MIELLSDPERYVSPPCAERIGAHAHEEAT